MSLDSVTEYALSFSEDAVHLQRREPASDAEVRPSWRHLGSVEFDSPDFREEFVRLRLMAGGDEALPVTLLIPDDQILYTTLTVAPGADRDRAVGKALDGLTPYAIEDLAFDWEGDGDSVRVAAVARQTLREARDFAAQYGFEGQGFRAAPAEDSFAGEPIFVLEAPPRARPAVDPAQAGVTSADLQFAQEDEAAGPAADLLDLGGDATDVSVAEVAPDAEETRTAEAATTEAGTGAAAVLAEAGPASQPEATQPAEPVPSAAAETESETPAAEAEPEGKAEPVAVPEPAVEPHSAPEPDQAAEPQPEPAPEPEHPHAPEAEPTTAAAESDPPAAAPEPEPSQDPPAAESAAEAPTAGSAKERAVSAASDTEDPEPVAPVPPVVRHGPSAGQGGPELNPRARAVHERAADARQARSIGAAPAPMRRPGQRGGLVGLVGMLALLVAGLILIWAFLVPGDRGHALTETAPVAAPAASAPQDSAAGPTEQAAAETPAPQTPAAETPAPQTIAEAEPEAMPVPVQQAAPAAAPARVSALTEEERRRVIVAAAAVAAAVVPPSAHSPAAQAPASAASEPARAVAATRPVAAPSQPARAAAPASADAPARSTAPAASRPAQAADTTVRLSSSARPQLAPRRSTPQTSAPRADTAPRVPTDPLPYAASQGSAQPIRAARPPERARRAAPAPAAAAPAEARPAATASTTPALRGSSRPPLRPEGSAPELAPEPNSAGPEAALTPAEAAQLRGLIRDLGRHGLVSAQAPRPDGMTRLAQARPVRKPGGAATASDAPSASAIDAALRSAAPPPPDKPGRNTTAAATPARDSGGLLRGSSRPQPRPGKAGATTAPSPRAVDAALSEAAAAPPPTPGAVQLSALASSPLPPRRGDAAPAAAEDPPAAADPGAAGSPAVAAPAAAAAAATPGPSEAELTARRALDEQLQAQAEARIRARAQADAAAEAKARAQAEARARAQAEAEERAARARQQDYKPPEIDNEPELAATALSKGVSSASVAKAATTARGMDTGRTTIIGIIGAGQASRALIRLRSGKVVTVRLGDRIDGGTINSIGNGRLTYVKAGRTHELRMLDGR
ncbi:hypothetical protein [Paracoccus aminovorans]|uniref:hypothetical protein n=1 Tax=Paracoccus aminovorans TaxID=34004 RepID=UPI002B257A4A|nr:hypothetical protein [Paracoccus aminovorans]